MSRRPQVAPPWIAAALAAVLATACKGDSEEKVPQLSRSPGAEPVVVVGGAGETGPVDAEAEPNDEPAAAQVLELGSGARGTLASETDVDLYAFTAKADGVVHAVAAGVDGLDLVVDLRDEKGKVLYKSDRGPEATSEGVAGAPVVAGRRYLVGVSEFVPKRRRKGDEPRTEESEPYTLRLRAGTAEAGFETEPNAKEDGAAIVAVGGEGRGHIGWNGDADLWRVDLSGLPAAPEPAVEGEAAALQAIDIAVVGVPVVAPSLTVSAGGEELTARQGVKGGSVEVRGLVPPPGADAIWVKVGGKRSNPDELYVLRVAARTLVAGEEAEPNDELAAAQLLDEAAPELRGSLAGGDVDHFRLPAAPDSRLVEIAVRPAGDTDVAVEAVTAAGSSLARSDAGKVGAPERLGGVSVPAGQELLVRVTGTASGREPGSYQLEVSAIAGGEPMPSELDPMPPATEF